MDKNPKAISKTTKKRISGDIINDRMHRNAETMAKISQDYLWDDVDFFPALINYSHLVKQ